MSGSYFLYHSIGLYPGKGAEMAEALAAFSRDWARDDDAQWPSVLAARDDYLALWRGLIGATPGTLTSAENVTTALFSLIGALPAERLRGKRILTGADCFPSLHFLLAGLQDRLGFTLDTVPLRPGETWLREEDLIARWGADVGLALLTFVTSTASYRADLGALCDHARAMGSLTVLDLTQGIGILPFDLADCRPDAVVSTSLKWLCGTPGAGMLWVDPALAATCRPDLRGWFSQPNPFNWDLDAFDYAPDARRFDHGTPSVLACVGSVPALRWHAAQDPAALLAHTRALQDHILQEAARLGLASASPSITDRRGGSVMLRLGGATDPQALVARLRARRIHTDARGQVIRLSPGIMTGHDDVERLFAALQAELAP